MGRDNEFEGKVIAIAGGASGIGLSTALTLFHRGASLSISDIDPTSLTRTESTLSSLLPSPSDLPARLLLHPLDVRDRPSIKLWIQKTVQKFGKLDGAANCVGVIGKHHGTRDVVDLEDGEWDLIMGVNLGGMMGCLREELRAILAARTEEGGGKEGGKGGSVVCVSSVQGVMGFAGHAAYSASKHGVIGLVRCAAKEVGGRGVRVNAVTPGTIDTPLLDKRNALEGVDPLSIETPIRRKGTSQEVANVICWLLSDESSFVTGAVHSVDGGWDC